MGRLSKLFNIIRYNMAAYDVCTFPAVQTELEKDGWKFDLFMMPMPTLAPYGAMSYAKIITTPEGRPVNERVEDIERYYEARRAVAARLYLTP